MFRYIILIAVVGTACAAPASPSTSTLESTTKNAFLDVEKLSYYPAPESSPPSAPAPTLALDLVMAPDLAAAPALDPAPASAPAPAPIATLPAELEMLLSSSSTAELSAGRSPDSAPKALSLLVPVRTPASTTKLSHMIHAVQPVVQIPQYAYALPAVAPLPLAAAPSSYSIEQHGYRITY